MSSEEKDLSENHMEEEQPSEDNQTTDGIIVNSNSESDETGHDQPMQAVEGQISKVDESEEVNRLNEEIRRLEKEISGQRETQKAAEAALEHLRVAHAEADGKAQELSKKLVEG